MAVINMFRKEALRNQYKSQEFGHSVIKQPGVINKSIATLAIIVLAGFIAMQFITLVTKQTYRLNISAENYHPLVMSQAVVINEQLTAGGTLVNKNQPLARLTIIDEITPSNKSQMLTAARTGIYFQSQTDSTIIPAYQPIGYLLKNTGQNDFSFWLQKKPVSPVKVGETVSLLLDEQTITGRISMVIGSFIEGRGQKISIKLDNSMHLSLLVPEAQIRILLSKQPKTIKQLLGY